MSRDLDLGNIGRYLDAYDRHAGDENMQNGFAFAMLKECYPEEESYDTAKRRFFATEGKSTQDVYAYFRKLYDDAKTYHGGEVKKYNANPESFTAEQENEFLRKHPYQAFLKTTRNLPQNVRDTAFGIVFAEESRSNVSEAFADKLLAMPENERNAALWGAYVLSPETSSNFFKRVGNRLLENFGDNSFNISSYWEQSQKGVNPNTVYDAVKELDALGEDGKIKPEKLAALNKKLNELRGENSIFNEESSQVYGEKFGNLFSGKGYKADEKEYTADFIEAEYKKGKRAKDTFRLVSQLREIMRTRYEKQNIVAQTLEDATVVGVEMLKYVGASAAGTALTKNPWGSASLVGAVMYSEFKPQMFNALRHEGNMSVEDANKYANFATAGMIAANYIGYTRWIKAVKPSSYLLGTEITKANARDYFFHAIAEMPKTFLREGVAETASEYMESVVEYATKSWVADHEGATFEQKQLWDNFCQDFLDTTRIMPALMFGSTLLGGGLAVNKIRRDSGAGWNLRQLVSPAEAVNHQVQAQAAMAQADAAVLKAGESLGEKSTAYDFVRKYSDAKTDEERVSLLSERFGTEEERANAKAALENVDKLNDEVNRTFAQILADAAKQNADETERLDRESQAIDGVFDEAENSQKGSPKFKIVEELLDRLDARDSVVEVNSAADLERVGYSAEKAQSIMDSMGRKGFFSAEDGKIYMLPAHFKNGVDAFRTFVHERGHWLAQKIKDTPEYAGMLQRIVQITGGEEVLRSLLPSSYANDDVNVAAEEYLMRVVERVALEDVLNANQRGVWNFFKTKLKKWFGGDQTVATIADRELAEMARSIYRRATAPEGQKPTNRWEVFTPENNGKPASGIWQVVDADALITSTDKGYDDKLQPRNRQRKGSEIQTTEIATNLNPALLGASAKSSDGAPIIDSRGMVISGNGRTLAIRKAYEAERPERAIAYKNFVAEQAERLGLDVPPNFKKPMLVRRVDDLGGMSMEEFAARSNKSDLAKMSNAENAIADARRILDAHLLDSFFPSDNGDVLAASNNDFITGFLDIIGGREEYIDKHGARKPNLAPRIKSAVLAAMLNPEKRDIIENLLDNPQGWSGLINGLFGSVANLAKLDGNADYNLAEELSKAVEIFVGLQRAGESVATFNAQGDMFNEPISDEVGFLIELFEKNTRTPTGISGVLNEYYNLVKNIDTTTQDMFGAENPSKIDELRAAYQKYSTSLTEEPNVSWRDTGEPTDAEIAEARRQKDEVKAKWTNPDGTMKKGYHLAPNGKPSKLTEEQWLQVRTPNFKKWFGDWETLAIINEVENMPARAIKLHESLDKAGIKEAFKSFGEVENRRDGRVVVFPSASAGKIRRHKGFDSGTVIKNFKTLFETAIPAISEEEVLKDGHKAHGNIDAVEHYVNKFSVNGIEYFIRFTVPVIRNNKGAGNVHSSAISEVSIYKNGDSTLYPLNTAGSSSPSFVDGKLADFLNAVNKKDVSKVVDENGEPLVVYHGTDWKPLAEKAGEAVFKSSLIKNSSEGFGFYFTKDKTLASGFGEPVACFLNLRNPKYAYDRLSLISTEELEDGDVDVENFDAENAARIRNALGEWKNAMEAKGWDFYNEIDPYLLDGLPKETNTIESILDYVLSADSFLKAEDYNAEDFYNDAREAAADVFGIDGYISENYGNDSGVYVALKSNQIKSATDNVGTFSENPDIRWSIREDSDAEKIDTQHRELYERYKNGDQAAYEEAAKLVADYAKSKGYDVKVYHGTGADGFNVADATSSHEENGEGAQAHGMGLYLATQKSTSERYQRKAKKSETYTVNGKAVDIRKIGEDLNLPELKVELSLSNMKHWGFNKFLQQLDSFIKKEEENLKFYEKGLDALGNPLENDSDYLVNKTKSGIEFRKQFIREFQSIREWIKENLGEDVANDSHSISVKSPEGKVFDWLTNLKPENVIDEEKSLSEQPEIWEKLKKIWKTVVYPKIEKGLENDDSAAAHAQHYKPTNWIAGEAIVFGWGNFLGKTRFNKLMLEHGIRGITYDGQIDGRCYVSFEGGSTVKLQDPFTFDDNGELIPLSERFDEGNPDMRWKDDTGFSPIEVKRELLAQKKIVIKSDENTNRILGEFSAQEKGWVGRVVKILSGILPKSVMSRIGEVSISNGSIKSALHHSRGALKVQVLPQLEEIISDSIPITKEPIARNDGQLSYPMSHVIEWNKVPYVMTSVILEDKNGKRFYNHELTEIKRLDDAVHSGEDLYPRASEANKHHRALNEILYNDIWNVKENDGENSSRLRFLLRQDRTENPVIWASIVLAKEILNGRGITRAKLEKLLPTEQFDGSKQNYAVERAQRIAEKTKATQKQFSKDLDIAIRKAESNLYWQDEFVENAYRAFSKGGEEYGFAKQRLMQYLKDLRNKELNKVKGYETDDFDVDLVDAILKAQEAEPERVAGDESKTAGEEIEEELEESGGAFEGDEELSGKKTPLAPSKIRDVIGAIRREVVKRVRDSDGDQKTLDEKYRKTLVNVLTDAMKELVYGKEREDIGKKIEELKNVKHAVITVKDGERVGQKIDNFTLRAENIALRIFRRGVRDSKKLMTEKLDAILERRGKKPSRMQRDDKRSMTGLVQQRIYDISRYVKMDAEALEDVRREAIAKLEDVDGNFVQDAEKGKIREDVEDVRAELENVLHDLEMFGGWDDKSRAEMAQALEFLEKTIDTETAAQRERVEKRKERNAAVRKIISDALKMSEHNAARDGGMRVAIRKVLNGSLPFDSFLGLLGESATGETRRLFEEWRKDLVARIDRAANAKANEVFQTQQKFIKLVEDSYSANFHDALKRLLEKKGDYEKFSKMVDGMRQPMSLANVIQLYVSAAQKNYERNFYEHRVRKSEEDIAEYRKIQKTIDSIQLNNVDEYAKGMLKQSRESLERARDAIVARSVSEYISELEEVLSDGDKRFIEGLRQLYKDELPSISAVAKRVIGLPIEQADALYMPVKVKRSGNLGEGVPQVPVVPKSLSQRVPHLRDLDETADPISLFTDRISENAQFKHFSELYIEMRGIFGDGDLQDLIKQRCGADVLTGLKEFIADIATGKTRGPQNELLRKTNGLTAVMLLGFNLGSGVRQVLPGMASFAPAIGGWNVFKNMMSFFTPEGFAAALEICRSDTGRRRFEIGNMQIMEELLSTPDRNRFWAAYKRHALFFNRFADKLSIMFIGQGIYRSGVEEYLRRGFSEADAKRLAMSDMWQIAERTQASGRTHNMSHWQRRGGEYGKALGLFSSPPQLMFSMAYSKCRRALALGVKTPEGRAAVWDALSTLFYVSVCVEGSYALSGVLWNALLKGFFDDDDGEQILKQMALGPFGGLFVFGRIIEGAGSNYGTSLAPIEQLSRPIRHTKNLLFDAGQFDADKALEDLDKLANSLFPLYRDGKKLYENLTD